MILLCAIPDSLVRVLIVAAALCLCAQLFSLAWRAERQSAKERRDARWAREHRVARWLP